MIGIILTCTVTPMQNISFLKQIDPQQRLDCYLKSIRSWIFDDDIIKNKIPIVIIDNSNWEFTGLKDLIKKLNLQDRLEILNYLENKYPISMEKGYWECLSIQRAIKDSILLKQCDFIIKITGRYYIPTLLSKTIAILTNRQLDQSHRIRQKQSNDKQVDCIRQHAGFRCEIVGFRKDLYLYLFDHYGINPRYILEKALIDRTTGLYSVLLPQMEIEPTRNGGFDTLINIL